MWNSHNLTKDIFYSILPHLLALLIILLSPLPRYYMCLSRKKDLLGWWCRCSISCCAFSAAYTQHFKQQRISALTIVNCTETPPSLRLGAVNTHKYIEKAFWPLRNIASSFSPCGLRFLQPCFFLFFLKIVSLSQIRIIFSEGCHKSNQEKSCLPL